MALSPASSHGGGGVTSPLSSPAPLVFTPADPDVTPIQIKPVVGASGDGTNMIEVYDDANHRIFSVAADGSVSNTQAPGHTATVSLRGPTNTLLSLSPVGASLTAPTGAEASIQSAGSTTALLASDDGGGNQTIGFFNHAAVLQPAAIADAAGGAVIDVQARAALNALLAGLRTLGLIAT
jgi:hypothetical protein